MKGSAAKIQMTGLDELFGVPAPVADGEHIQEVALSELHPFKNHPFHVVDDERMQETAESVAKYGVLVPGIVRPRPEGGYEIVAGHRRKRASELAGKDTMPVIVRELDDDESTIIMVDSNLQREKIMPSEKAFAYKMKLDAMKRKAGRPSKENGAPVGPHLENTKSRDVLAEQTGESREQIRRYIRLTQLIPEWLKWVDDGKLPMRPAVEISYLISDEQSLLFEIAEDSRSIPSLAQAQKLKEYSQRTGLDKHLIEDILLDETPAPMQITLKKKRLHQYFPLDYSQAQMEEIIFSLMEKWRADQEGGVPIDENG